MKLSEAVAIGLELVPQTQGEFQVRNEAGEIVSACAIGAACWAADVTKRIETYSQARKLFPQLFDTINVHLPEYGEFEGPLEDVIVHYNDRRKAPAAEIVTLLEQLGY
jgi:hypothetical protein